MIGAMIPFLVLTSIDIIVVGWGYPDSAYNAKRSNLESVCLTWSLSTKFIVKAVYCIKPSVALYFISIASRLQHPCHLPSWTWKRDQELTSLVDMTSFGWIETLCSWDFTCETGVTFFFSMILQVFGSCGVP